MGIVRREEEYMGSRVMVMAVPGKRRGERPKRSLTSSGMTFRSENCQGSTRKIELNGSVLYETSNSQNKWD